MRPTNGLDNFVEEYGFSLPTGVSVTDCLERYLDAKRSALLFSKGVVLVEGDGEEILLPALVENALGVSLDEIGISVINIGSVAFEHIASIFSEERLQRYCSVVTDSDTYLKDAKKSKENASKLGESRKAKLDALSESNPWIKPFYADYTFEVDFSNIPENIEYIKKVIDSTYKYEKVVQGHLDNLTEDLSKRYDEVLTLAENMGKGWYATVLSSVINEKVYIPEYLVKAIAFASQEVVNNGILRKMAIHVLQTYEDSDACELIKILLETNNNTLSLIEKCCDTIEDHKSFFIYYNYLKELGAINE